MNEASISMSANSGAVVFKKTFKVVPGAKLDKIYHTDQSVLTIKGAYQALIQDANTKKIIGELPTFGHAFDESNQLWLWYPGKNDSVQSAQQNCHKGCTLVLRRDSQSSDYGFVIERKSSIDYFTPIQRGVLVTTKSELIGLGDFDFPLYYKANTSFDLEKESNCEMQYCEAKLSNKDIFLANKYGVLDGSRLRLYEYGTLKYTLSDPQMEIIKEDENYKCEFTGNINGTRHAIPFSLDEVNVDRSLLKQFELESQIQKISKAAEVISVDAVAYKISSDRVYSHLLAKAILENSSQDQNLQVGIAHYFSQLVKREDDLQRLVKGGQGPAGPQGPVGPAGRDGSAGATASQVADLLVRQKADQLGKAVLGVKVGGYDSNKDKSKLPVELAKELELQTSVKDLLKGDTAFQTALKGERGSAGLNGISPTEDQIARTLMRTEEFIERVLNTEVNYLIDSTYTPKILADKVTEKLKVDTTFKAAVKGDRGLVGSQGPVGPSGTAGATVGEVANELVNQKAAQLGKAILGVKVGGRSSDKDKSKLSLELAANSDLQQGVANKLKTDPGKAKGPQGLAGQDADPSEIINRLIQNTRFKRSLKGDDGPAGERGKDGTPGAPGLRGPTGPIGPQGLEGQDADSVEIAHRLARNSRFRQSLKGDGGPEGPHGERGEDGAPGIQGLRGRDGKHGKKGEQGERGDDGTTGAPGLRGSTGPIGPQGLEGQDADPIEVAHRLANSARFKRSLKGEDGEPGTEGFPGLDGKDGRDADHVEVAEKLVTTKADKLGAAVLDAIGSGGNLATQVANKVNLNQRDLVNKVDVIKLTEGVVNKLTAAEAKQITDATVNAITSDATKRNNLDPNAFKKYEKFAEKLAELLLQKSAINQSGANKLVEDKVSDWALAKYLLIHGGLSKEDKDKAFLLAEEKVSREKLAEYLLEYAGLQNNQNEASATIDHLLSHFFNTRAGAVTAALRSNPGRVRGPKGEQGERGDDGPEGPRGERGVEGTPGVPGLQGLAGRDGIAGLPGEQGLAGQDADLSEIMSRLAHNFRLKRPLKGDDSLSEQVLDSRLNRSAEFQQKLQLRVTQGESYDQDKNEANIELEMEGKSVVIATFLEIGYFFKGDNLYIRNHITGENILIPKNFHFLKVVEDGLDNYKLAFCNNLGNSFFDHKKYDPEYADLPEEYRSIDLRYIKNAANIDLSKYYYHTHTPLFAVKQGELEGQSLEDYRADVYEIAKDKKIGTLVDEFGFFEGGKFHHIDHHYGSDEHSEELDVRIQDHEGNLQIGGNTVHPITLYDGHLDLIDYLGYSVNL